MASKYLCLLFIAVLIARISAQSEDELHIPVENDNQFPPENDVESDGSLIEGSGLGAIEDPLEPTTKSNVPLIEETQQLPTEIIENKTTKDENLCPASCVCHFEYNDKVVDCSGYGLTEFPSPIDPTTTTLNIQNNKLTEIPKEIAELKQLKNLNVANNSIKDLAAGSISELPELAVLKLGNNKLVDYPQDLKNSFGLTKLEELDLGGNDMRTVLSPETFTSFTALKRLTLPSSTTELVDHLCASLKETLETVCTETCDAQTYECPDAPQTVEEDLLAAVLPGAIAFMESTSVESDNHDDEVNESNSDKIETTPAAEDTSEVNEITSEKATDVEFSLRAAVSKAAEEETKSNSIVEAKSQDSNNEKSDVAVGATTVDTKTGGVDKSIIGLIIAGMVVIVAGITIKKNWSSIKNKFSSSPRPANNRNNGTTNGTTPEEVPLQDKSPV